MTSQMKQEQHKKSRNGGGASVTHSELINIHVYRNKCKTAIWRCGFSNILFLYFGWSQTLDAAQYVCTAHTDPTLGECSMPDTIMIYVQWWLVKVIRMYIKLVFFFIFCQFEKHGKPHQKTSNWIVVETTHILAYITDYTNINRINHKQYLNRILYITYKCSSHVQL